MALVPLAALIDDHPAWAADAHTQLLKTIEALDALVAAEAPLPPRNVRYCSVSAGV